MVLLNTTFFSAAGDTLKLSVFSLWDNLANNSGGVVALMTFFFFELEWLDKDGAVVMGNGADNDNGDDGGDVDDDNSGDNDNDNNNAVLGHFDLAVFFTYPT